MAYERYPRGNSLQGDYEARGDDDYMRDYGSGDSYSSAREYEAAGMIGPRGGYGRNRYRGGDSDRGYYSQGRNPDFGSRGYGYNESYRGSYASDGRRFTDVDRDRGDDRGYGRPDRHRGGREYRRQYAERPRDYDYDDRGFFARAGDEVRSWFGDEDAERRRALDERYDARAYGRDDDYGAWRSQQIAELDRDYDEYRRENRSKFSNEFGAWRTERQGQRTSLQRVNEHMEVVGSDGEHIGTVDKVRGDRILLTKSDPDAGGRHHSIPSRWIDKVDDKVTVRKTAGEAKAHWRDEERNSALFGDKPEQDQNQDQNRQGRALGRAFSGTYES